MRFNINKSNVLVYILIGLLITSCLTSSNASISSKNGIENPEKIENVNIILYSSLIFEPVAPYIKSNFNTYFQQNNIENGFHQFDPWEKEEKYKLSYISDLSQSEGFEYMLVIYEKDTQERFELDSSFDPITRGVYTTPKYSSENNLYAFLYSTEENLELWNAHITIENKVKSFSSESGVFLRKVAKTVSMTILDQLKKDGFLENPFKM